MYQAPRLSQLTYVGECPVPPANAIGVHDFRQRLLRRGRVYVPRRYVDDYTLVPSRQSFLVNHQRVGEQAVARLRVGVGFECHGRVSQCCPVNRTTNGLRFNQLGQ